MAKPRPIKKKDPKKDGKKEEKPKLPPCPYSAAELKEFRALLKEMKRRLSGDIEKLEDAGFRKQQDGGDLSSMPLHMADQGTDSFEQDITLGLMETEGDELQEIDEALDRIKEGTYGICELCHKAVPKGRLQAIPYARLCVPCKTKEEGS
jgi:DnaK suppressor protein